MTATSMPHSKHLSNVCWNTAALPEVVMFNGHYKQGFMRHSHDIVTVVAVTNGKYRLQLDNSSHIVSPGDVVVIGANQFHAAEPVSSEGWRMRTLHVPTSLLSIDRDVNHGSDKTVWFQDPVLKDNRNASELFLDFHRSTELQTEQNRQKEQIHCFNEWFRSRVEVFKPEVVEKERKDPYVQQAAAKIASATGDQMLMMEIAEELGISAFALNRRFKKQFGMSPHNWRIQLRASYAAEKLRQGEPLVDVAMDCGFADQAHLTRTFRKVYGVTPGQYQQKQ